MKHKESTPYVVAGSKQQNTFVSVLILRFLPKAANNEWDVVVEASLNRNTTGKHGACKALDDSAI